MILPLEGVSEVVQARLRAWRSEHCGQVLRISADGELEWRVWARESIRSDSHQLTLHVGERLELYGSPARSAGLPHNVFGSGDLAECARSHLDLASSVLGCSLPSVGWHVSRVDVTSNYDLGSAAGVRQALAVLRHASGGRYILRDAAESVYWGKRGAGGRSGKAYAKGPHMAREVSAGRAVLSFDELGLCDRLLRLELTLGRVALRRLGIFDPFGSVDGSLFDAEHERFFSALVGGCEVVSMDSLADRVLVVAGSRGSAHAALATLARVRVEGVEVVRASMPSRTWHRHKKVLFGAGLSWADLASGRVVELRRAPLVLGSPVRSFADMRFVA